MDDRRGPLAVGVIGCGYAAESLHLPVLRSLPGVHVVAIADTDHDRLRSVGDRFAISHRHSDADALLQDDVVEAVLVCVPPRAHASVVLAALDAGKHLLVEKPLCLDQDGADRIVDRARRTSLTAMVGFNLRFHRHVRAARQAITDGFVGAPELVRTTWSSGLWQEAGLSEWRRHRRLGGGVLNELAVHHLDLWRFLFRSDVCEVFAATHSDHGDDTRATVTARLENGVLALGGFAHRGAAQHEIEIVGEAGRLLLSLYRFDGFELVPASTPPGSLRSRARALRQTLSALPGILPLMLRGGQFLDSYRTEWRHFVDRVQSGSPVDSTFEDGRRALELVLAAQHSARTGRPVRIGQGSRRVGDAFEA